MTTIDWPSLTDTELAATLTAARAETERRFTITYAEAQAAQLAETYAHAVKDAPPLDGATLPTGGWGPGQRVDFDGEVFVNISGGWLAHGPSEYARGWRREGAGEPNPETPIAWEEGLAVKVGDLVTHDGKTWRCKTAHTTHAGWPPSAATHAVWEGVVI